MNKSVGWSISERVVMSVGTFRVTLDELLKIAGSKLAVISYVAPVDEL